jgi:hypothetical protein
MQKIYLVLLEICIVNLEDEIIKKTLMKDV